MAWKKNTAFDYLSKAIKLIQIEQKIVQWQLQNGNTQTMPNRNTQNKAIFWTGTPTEFVEWTYGMIETSRFNDGDIEIEEFIDHLCQIFSVEVKDCYNTFRAIRRRTGSRTLFLDEMIEKLEKRMDDMDNGIFKKKRKK